MNATILSTTIAILAMLLSVALSAYVGYCATYVNTTRRLYRADGESPPDGLWKEAQSDFVQLIKGLDQ